MITIQAHKGDLKAIYNLKKTRNGYFATRYLGSPELPYKFIVTGSNWTGYANSLFDRFSVLSNNDSEEEVLHTFISDYDKMIDFNKLSKEEFLNKYPFLSNTEYQETKRATELPIFKKGEKCFYNGEEARIRASYHNGLLYNISTKNTKLNVDITKLTKK